MKSGYKQTEVGVIPEEWEVKRLGELFDFSGGYSASRDQLSATGHCYLHYGDIHGSSKTSIDTDADFHYIPKLDIPLKNISSKSLLIDGDVVFVDASEDDLGTSKHVVVVNKDKKPFISGLHTIVAKSKSDELAHEYRHYCFQTAATRSQFLFYAVGTKVSGISKSNIPKLFLPVPPLPEQRAIAAALSDVDALLGGLERLIAKKRDLKQAAMQQLLTGQTRLPGFHGAWEVKRLGDVAVMGSGGTPPSSIPTYYDGDIPWASISDMTKGGKFILTTDRNLTLAGLTNSSAQIFPVGTILYAMYASLGECSIAGIPLCTSQAILGIRPKQQLHGGFLFYFLMSLKGIVKTLGQQGTQSNLNKGMVQSFSISIPPTLPEQIAIAAVLSDMDAELAALEQRRDKTRALKQAMMQELLTGRTRLV
jgi:type I restriction enzyme S subunit